MTMRTVAVVVLVGLMAGPSLGWAQPMAPMHPAAGSGGGGTMAAMDRMNRDMAAVPMTGDSDRDFAAMMVPHHQGAVDMARDELQHGKDPAMRRIAQDIIRSQEREIAQFKAYLARHPAPPK